VAPRDGVCSPTGARLGTYFGMMMLMCALSMIMTIVVLNLHHRSPEMYEMPDWVRGNRQRFFVC